MSEPARQHVPDDAVPVPVLHDEKTLEVQGAVPELIRANEDTVPVRSSLEKILRHEMLRHQSASDDP
jgi:hypothetical protein